MKPLSKYQKNILVQLEQQGKCAYGFANLRSLLAMQKKGLIDFTDGAWKLTDKGKRYTQ